MTQTPPILDATLTRPDLLPALVPTWLLALACGILFCLWMGVRRSVKPRGFLVRYALAMPVASATAFLLFQTIARVIWLAGAWPLWVAAALSGGVLELVLLAYERECSVLRAPIRRMLMACRLLAILVALMMLLQPVYVTEQTRRIQRRVAVLLDESASMWRVDTQWRLNEVLDVAQAFGELPGSTMRTNRLDRDQNIALWDRLTPEQKTALRQRTEVPRVRITRDLLVEEPAGLLRKLGEKYDLDLIRFGRSVDVVADRAAYASNRLVRSEAVAVPIRETLFRSVTDMTTAIEEVLRVVPSDELAGVALFSDGRHTGSAGVAAAARRYQQASIPICTVLVGGSQPAFDFSVAEVRVQDTVFLGDRVRLTARIQATGAKGRKTSVRLMRDQEVLAHEVFDVETGETVTREVRFTDTPTEKGLRHYTVSIEPVEGETVKENNQWPVEVYVTDDRTNVLLVDRRPRWEFRYLRNLFYGRDKSVHLQFVLTEPDRIEGIARNPLPEASALRNFGEAEAGGLPRTRDAWRMFDVIILGDVGEDILTPEVAEEIRYCVAERGALLVILAGPERMPYSIQGKAMRELLPVVCQAQQLDWRTEGQMPFRVQLTPAGRTHDVMRLSSNPTENEQMWRDMEPLRWRLPIDDVKAGAEVLAYAATDADLEEQGRRARQAVSEAVGDADEAVRRLTEARRFQARQALLVSQNLGQGKVLMLLSDRTWRLRYRVGDTLHHLFWGQVMRWGTGEKMRAGNTFARVGTDQLNYTPDERIRILARFSTPDFVPLTNAVVQAVVRCGEKGQPRRCALTYRTASNGVYEGLLEPMSETGIYSVRIEAPEVQRVLGARYPEPLETQFTVIASRRPAEFADLTTDRSVPEQFAEITKGCVLSPAELDVLLSKFGEGRRQVKETVERNLWDSWWLFFIIIGLVTLEWLIRKKNGLA